MKARKQMKHQPLIQEAITQLAPRFNPKVADVKKGSFLLSLSPTFGLPLVFRNQRAPLRAPKTAIDQLLDKEYIERIEGQRDSYSYLA